MQLRLSQALAFSGICLCALLTSAAAQHPLAHPQPAPALLIATPVSADAARNPAATVEDALRSLAGRSGVVFLGRVDHIDRQPGVVTITLAVLDPVLGNPGPTYTLREWAGLWTLGRERYTVGQRAMFFLHAASAAGLSSPVDGQHGVVPVLPTSAGVAPQLDTRWLATRLQRPTNLPLEAIGAMEMTTAKTVIAHWSEPHPIVQQPAVLPLNATVAR